MNDKKTMPTNDERRQMATKLRQYVGVDECLLSNVFGWECSDFANCEECKRSCVTRLTDFIEPEPERTCHIEHVKSGTLYDVWRYTCCDYEHSENKTDAGASKIPDNFCPNCGAKVI